MLVEALVLDRDHGFLESGGDLVRVEQNPVVVAGQGRDLLAVDVVDHGVLRLDVLGAVLERGKVLGDRHHDPEDERNEAEDSEAEEDDQETQLLHSRPALRRLAAAAGPAKAAGAGRLAVGRAVFTASPGYGAELAAQLTTC